MSVEIPLIGACRSDDVPLSTQPFILFSENLRWRRGLPETVGAWAPLTDGQDRPIRLGNFGNVDLGMYSDDQRIYFGTGRDVWTVDVPTGTVYRSENLMAVGNTGGWFFAGDQDAIYGRAAGFGNDQLQIIDRATLVSTTMTSAPTGGVGGGIVSGLFVMAGCSRWTSSGEVVGQRNVVRWSARRGEDPSSGDPINGPFGLQDWDPSAGFTSAGQQELDDCKEVVGAGVTSFGFMVWTDRNTHLFSPVQGVFVFQEQVLANRSLLGRGAWCEMNGAVYWYDAEGTLNVFDGGAVRQIENPTETISVNRIPAVGGNPQLAPFLKTGEVVLSYSDGGASRHQIVHNTTDGSWYPWKIDRLGFYAVRNGFSSDVGLRPDGWLYAHELRAKADTEWIFGRTNAISGAEPAPRPASVVTLPDPLPAIPTPIDPSVGGTAVSGSVGIAEVEPMTAWLSWSFLMDGSPDLNAPSVGNVVLTHTAAAPDGLISYALEDVSVDQNVFRLTLVGYDTPAMDAVVQHEDTATFRVGEDGADMRMGGKAVRAVLEMRDMVWWVRLGSLFLDPQRRGRR